MKGNKNTLEIKVPREAVIESAMDAIKGNSLCDTGYDLAGEALKTLKEYVNGDRFRAEKIVLEHFKVSTGQEFVDVYGEILATFISDALGVEIFPGIEEQEEDNG